MPRIELDSGAVFTLCLLFYLDPAGIFVPFVLAACAHEFGHCTAAVLCGGDISAIRAGGFGAEIQMRVLPYRLELICTLAGPAVNLILFLCTAKLFETFAMINLLLAGYNLLPVEPLDGGKVLKILLMQLLPDYQPKLCKVIRGLVLSILAAAAVGYCFIFEGGIWPLLMFGILILRLPKENLVAKRRALP